MHSVLRSATVASVTPMPAQAAQLGQYAGSGGAKGAVLLPIFAAFYVLPVLLAWLRRSPRRWLITLVAVLLGWTGIGWVAAMVMNFAYSAPTDGVPDRPHLPSDLET